MTWKLVLVVAGLVVGIASLRLLAGETGGNALNPRGRIELPVHADYILVDDKGRPIPGTGGGLERVCEVDAVVLVADGRVKEVTQKGASRVDVGEEIVGAGAEASYAELYRDEQGRLHQGCAPESWELHPDIPTAP